MIVRIIAGICAIALGAGFIWFAGNVIVLGTREFFKTHANADEQKKTSKKSK